MTPPGSSSASNNRPAGRGSRAMSTGNSSPQFLKFQPRTRLTPRRYDAGLGAGLIKGFAGLNQLDLLEAVLDQYRPPSHP